MPSLVASFGILRPLTIEPHGEAVVASTLDPNVFAGPFRKTFYLRTDDPETPSLMIPVSGEVRPWWTVTPARDPARARLARLLDQALASGRYDSWVPAFYVIGRWSLLARYDEHGRTLDDRSWAYADEEVRRKTVETIRRYKDSALMSEAPGPRRLSLTALFAAAALTCGDESLAAELARRIPSALFNAVAGSVMRTTSQTFRRLKNLAEDDGNGPESFPSAHDSPHNNQQ